MNVLPTYFQESSVQQSVAIETPTEHTTYSYQHNKWKGGRGRFRKLVLKVGGGTHLGDTELLRIVIVKIDT